MNKENITEKILEYLRKNQAAILPQDLYYGIFGEDYSHYNELFTVLTELEKSGYIDYTKKGKVISTESSGLIRCIFRSSSKGFGFASPIDGQDTEYYIHKSKCNNAIDGDTVLISLLPRKYDLGENKKIEGAVNKIVSHSLTKVTGTLMLSHARKKRFNYFYLVPDSKKINFPIDVDYDSIGDAEVGDKVEVEIYKYPTDRQTAKSRITLDFGQADSREANYASILHEHNIFEEFPPEVLEEADKESQKEISVNSRLDLRERLIFTIDGKDAKDLDDAISVEKTDDGFILGVHIADVSDYVKENSTLDKEAFTRGTSVYFTDKVVPMLPKALSNGSCSLNAGTDKYTLSAFMTLNKKGDILQTEVFESIINSKIRGVYSELNDVIENRENSEYYEKYSLLFPDALDNITELYNILDRKSVKRGALDLETTEAKILLDEDGEPYDIIKVDRGVSEKIIEQFMLCANEGVASYLKNMDMPCVYRIHEDPDFEKIHNFTLFAQNAGVDVSSMSSKTLRPSNIQKVMNDAKSKGLSSIVSQVLLRSLMKAKYSSECKPHFGLAMDTYCHFTSPIRRYPDLATHRIIKKVLKGELDENNINRYSDFAKDAAKNSSEREIEAQTAERDIEDLYKAIYMEQFIGKTFPAVITGVTNFGFFAELPNTCEGLVPIGTLDNFYEYDERNYCLRCGTKVFSLGQPVKVKVVNSDRITGKVDLELTKA